MRQITKSHEFPEINSLSPIIAPEKNLFGFQTDQAYFASWPQCCRYFRHSTKDMQQNLENAYDY